MAFEQFVMDAIRTSLEGKFFLVDLPFSDKHTEIAALLDYCQLQTVYLNKFGYDGGMILEAACKEGYGAFLGKEEAREKLKKIRESMEETATLLETSQPLIARNERIMLLKDFIRDFRRDYLEKNL